MRLFSWNVNGVRAIEKKGFLNWVDSVAPIFSAFKKQKQILINYQILFKILKVTTDIGILELEKGTVVWLHFVKANL